MVQGRAELSALVEGQRGRLLLHVLGQFAHGYAHESPRANEFEPSLDVPVEVIEAASQHDSGLCTGHEQRVKAAAFNHRHSADSKSSRRAELDPCPLLAS